jgi:colicin import membrane protein
MIFGMGPFEILIIVVAGLIVFGPERLPAVAAQVGRMVRDFRRMTADLTSEFNAVTEELTGEFRAASQELSEELQSVQGDLQNEIRDINQAFRSETDAPAEQPLLNAGSWNSAPTFSSTPEASTVTGEAAAMNGHEPPRVASKADPRVDVSSLDLEELVVMPRTSRPSNGHHASNGVHGANGSAAPAAITRQPRAARRAAVVYQRPRA